MTSGVPKALWPRLSTASALLPLIRRALLDDPRAASGDAAPPVDVLPIIEDELFGYELAPRSVDQPVLVIGCMEDGIARVRRTAFDETRSGLRVATVHGQVVDAEALPVRRNPPAEERLFADWTTAAADVWSALEDVARGARTRWDEAMTACRSLENALTIASVHLAEWDPAVDFFGVPNQTEFGIPLRGANDNAGSLTLHHRDVWLLAWRTPTRIVYQEWSSVSAPEGVPALLPRNAKR